MNRRMDTACERNLDLVQKEILPDSPEIRVDASSRAVSKRGRREGRKNENCEDETRKTRSLLVLPIHSPRLLLTPTCLQ